MMRSHLFIDADDTLWENNIYFEEAIDGFITFLDHSELSREEVRTVLDEIERSMGYGSLNFSKSLIETYCRLGEKELCEEALERVRCFGDCILSRPIQLLAEVEETLDYLSRRHELILLTKGDFEEQSLKIARSGIQQFFGRVMIVPEKSVSTYRDAVSELRAHPEHTWMVGNSIRSDINPALSAGIKAVHIPHPHTWRLEHEPMQEAADGRLLSLGSFAELRRHF